jgi:large subunit ribosomal protein L6
MSRVGRQPIAIPKGVKVAIADSELQIQGPQGKLQSPVPPGISFEIAGAELVCKRTSDARQQRAFHGLARALAQNAIKGVTEGFKKELDIVGVGYRATLDGKKIVFSLGYSHPVEFEIPDGIQIAIEKQTRVVVSGIDRQRVGQVAADIRRLRKPDPYKQKGVRYVGEVLKKKAGKAGATGAK